MIAASTEHSDVRGDDRAVRAQAGELGDLLVAADRVDAVAEAREAQQRVDEDARPRRAGTPRPGRSRSACSRTTRSPRCTAPAGPSQLFWMMPLDDQRHAERGDERVDPQLRDDQAVGEADQRADAEHEQDRRHHVRRTGRPSSSRRAATTRLITCDDRQVERAEQDDQRLAGGDDAQRDRALEHVDDVRDGQEVAAADRRRRATRAGRRRAARRTPARPARRARRRRQPADAALARRRAAGCRARSRRRSCRRLLVGRSRGA